MSAAATVLVTGAFGQVGSRCAAILLERGRTVVALDLRTEKTAPRRPTTRSANFTKCDLSVTVS
jgi:nucleoside-diphosphate-sugar epimerase